MVRDVSVKFQQSTAARAQPPVFDLSAGRPCLDFANTLDQRPWGRECLTSYEDLVAWSREARGLTETQAWLLVDWAAQRPADSLVAFRRAIDLRELIYRVFSAVAAGRAPHGMDMERLNAALAEAMSWSRIVSKADGWHWDWAEAEDRLDRVWWPVVRSTADLLTSPDLGSLRECAALDCCWLFMDTSRNQRRRWCDMKLCGNRAKARRHYARQRRQRRAR